MRAKRPRDMKEDITFDELTKWLISTVKYDSPTEDSMVIRMHNIGIEKEHLKFQAHSRALDYSKQTFSGSRLMA